MTQLISGAYGLVRIYQHDRLELLGIDKAKL